MYPAYAKWIKSHRDLPLKLNQWNNVVVCSQTFLEVITSSSLATILVVNSASFVVVIVAVVYLP